VARWEAELLSDADVDIVYDAPVSQREAYARLLWNEVARKLAGRALEAESGRYVAIEDARLYTYDDIEAELKNDYDHIAKIALEGVHLVRPAPMYLRRLGAALRAADVLKIMEERQRWSQIRFEDAWKQIGTRGQMYPKTSLFHRLATFHCQICGLKYGGVKLARLPYWKAADTMMSRLSGAAAGSLRDCVINTVLIRQERMPSTGDILRLWNYSQTFATLTLPQLLPAGSGPGITKGRSLGVI
jgi:hypothetical protein